ncbi:MULTISPECIES: DUF1149 family protein [Enterococcus]|uniref:DUF1149 family protein n=1 Tax=Enterococcus TaxID=1350 RepID=UPI00065E84EB|nr:MULTISPECIES: DUF1149 family protein [Enterococcus]KAF1304710.1 hypothetical protein BAU16_00630 [Enterococcus sp. JM9B]
MEIQRQKPVVEAYHYDQRVPDKEYQTELKVGFAPLEASEPNYPKTNSILGARLEFRLVFDAFILAGRVSQINHVINRQIKAQEDVTKAEIDELVAPLFDIVKRLTYEVTEITTDEPGIKLNFKSEPETEQ